MKIIKVDTDNNTEVLDFPEGTIMEELEALRTMVGPECRLVEHVHDLALRQLSYLCGKMSARHRYPDFDREIKKEVKHQYVT